MPVSLLVTKGQISLGWTTIHRRSEIALLCQVHHSLGVKTNSIHTAKTRTHTEALPSFKELKAPTAFPLLDKAQSMLPSNLPSELSVPQSVWYCLLHIL